MIKGISTFPIIKEKVGKVEKATRVSKAKAPKKVPNIVTPIQSRKKYVIPTSSENNLRGGGKSNKRRKKSKKSKKSTKMARKKRQTKKKGRK